MSDIITKLAPIKDKVSFLLDRGGKKLSESETRRLVIDPTLSILGWDMSDVVDIQTEYPVFQNRVDYALLKDEKPVYFVEAKPLQEDIGIQAIIQAVNYGNTMNVPWSVLTNGQQWGIYCVHAQKPMTEKLVMQANILSSPPPTLDRFFNLLRKNNAGSNLLFDLWNETDRQQKPEEARHSTVKDLDLLHAVRKVEHHLKSQLFNEGRHKSFTTSSNSRVQFFYSGPYHGKDYERFIKINEEHLEAKFLVIYCPDVSYAWVIPSQELRKFLAKIPHYSGGKRWDPVIKSRTGRDLLGTNRKLYGEFDLTSYKISL